ncbi:uncharacterized protein DUF1788 [Mariniflexile fucanivorans]|uniref:Uncharacterized protein DUF1788 n=1 Tax=Mariniflexile fucanivorans TaxID=264023 RepID=A0A4R1RPG0_9FLAO|nr:BREX protein BrxB domain-containing protein [Mariniflexile fucanivorans]TCL67830.1 uncharacterized protein DUF1788 [Mariniflexile fucanivorans]
MNSADKIYDLMSDKGFQEPRTGNLFFPAYIYTYKPELEYEIRDQIVQLTNKLKRPNHYLDCLVINIYEELINYLKADSFSGSTIFDSILEKEKEDYEDALNWVLDEVDNGFYEYFEEKIKDHFKEKNEKRVFLIIYGFGTAFPYLRASDFLKKTEKLIKEFKVIVFYPGTYENSNYSMFNELNDDNLYRANHLNNQLGE